MLLQSPIVATVVIKIKNFKWIIFMVPLHLEAGYAETVTVG